MLRGSALAYIWPFLVAIFAYSLVLLWSVDWIREHQYTLTTTPFTIIGLALSIFLGFRNNACYDRWWEARKLWGLLVNTSRSFTRQALTWVDDPALARLLVLRTAAFAHVLRFHLRDQLHRLPELKHLLDPAEIEALQRESNVPNALLQGTSKLLRDAWKQGTLHALHVPMLDEAMLRFHDIQGACERIKNTPVPLSYTVLTHRIVGLYCVTLPFGLMDTVGWFTPVVVLIVSFAFLGLDSVGTQIEDPFEEEDPNDLPLTALSTMIEINVRQRLGDVDLPAPHEPVRGVLT